MYLLRIPCGEHLEKPVHTCTFVLKFKTRLSYIVTPCFTVIFFKKG
jgi:hypothetical protein